MDKRNILVTGAAGQLGSELRALAPSFPGLNFTFTNRAELTVEDARAVNRFFSLQPFDFCINCAAYTAVDLAEQNKDAAFSINATAVGNLAAACKKNGSRLIHISTDYVFNGKADVPYCESDAVDPVNLYGESKRLGEELALQEDRQTVIIRTSWLYSAYGKNFVKTMVRLMNEKEKLGVVNDQFGSPTYAADLADAVLKIISGEPTPGIYHYCNEGITNWYEFAVAIKEETGSSCTISPITTEQYPTPARRPVYSAFSTSKIREQFDLVIPGWRNSLNKCLEILIK